MSEKEKTRISLTLTAEMLTAIAEASGDLCSRQQWILMAISDRLAGGAQAPK